MVFFTLTYSNMPEVRLFFSGSVSKLKACTPIALNAKKLTAFPNVYLTHLIKLRKATKPGDSGAPLFDERQKITGIIVGHDEDYSYAIPIHKVIEFFQQSKL